MGSGYGPGTMMMDGGRDQAPGMMGAATGGCGTAAGFRISPTSSARIAQIEKAARKKQWDLMEKMHELHWQADGAGRGGRFDEDAACKRYDAMVALHEQTFENSLEARKRVDSVLTPQQRERLQRSRENR